MVGGCACVVGFSADILQGGYLLVAPPRQHNAEEDLRYSDFEGPNST